jgi:hypothetical protein
MRVVFTVHLDWKNLPRRPNVIKNVCPPPSPPPSPHPPVIVGGRKIEKVHSGTGSHGAHVRPHRYNLYTRQERAQTANACCLCACAMRVCNNPQRRLLYSQIGDRIQITSGQTLTVILKKDKIYANLMQIFIYWPSKRLAIEATKESFSVLRLPPPAPSTPWGQERQIFWQVGRWETYSICTADLTAHENQWFFLVSIGHK